MKVPISRTAKRAYPKARLVRNGSGNGNSNNSGVTVEQGGNREESNAKSNGKGKGGPTEGAPGFLVKLKNVMRIVTQTFRGIPPWIAKPWRNPARPSWARATPVV
jgi:hypothetical protein